MKLTHFRLYVSHCICLPTVLDVSFLCILYTESPWKHCLPQQVCLCYRPSLYFKLSATAAHWDCCVYSICMHDVWVCVSGRKCIWEWQTEKMRVRERVGELCVSGVCICIFVWVSVCAVVYVWVYVHVYGPGAGTCVCPWAGNAGVPGLSSASC